jgi:elongation factor P hydroxylase
MLQSDAAVLENLFNELFVPTWRTCLQGGAPEPVYKPAQSADDLNQIYFTLDYFSSALHEVAHWCLAGDQRRRQIDYGYWYAPDGRDALQQMEFEQVEVKPQALEWIFSRAAAVPFRVSADNLAQGNGASAVFKQAIFNQVQLYCLQGLPERAALWVAGLQRQFGGINPLHGEMYRLDDL